MTATTELPLLVECLSCHSTFVVPYGSPALSLYYAKRAVEWSNNHPCASFNTELDL